MEQVTSSQQQADNTTTQQHHHQAFRGRNRKPRPFNRIRQPGENALPGTSSVGEESQPATSSAGGPTPSSGRAPRNDTDSVLPQSDSSAPKRSHPRQRRPPRPVAESTPNLTQPDAKPQPQRKPRRAKFNATLTDLRDTPSSSEQPTEPPGGSEKRPPKPKRTRAPPADDLTSTLTRALRTPPYPDCPICFNSIRPEQPTWSCSPSTRTLADDDQDGSHCCWTTFHLKCIRSWADKSVKDLEEAWRTRGETRPGEWRCPGCQAKRQQVPHVYLCFCHRMPNPSPPRLATPHSCAQPCARPRVSGCEHACPLPCHPGPCPPCAVTVQRACFCGKAVRSTRCQAGGSAQSAVSFSCTEPCNKPLSCGNLEHRCMVPCHLGPCTPCLEIEELRCWCGKETKNAACGESKMEEGATCGVAKNDGSSDEQVWIGRYGCGQPCNRPFACSYHFCSKSCHPPSRIPPPCPFDPQRITTCACGQYRIARSTDELASSSRTAPSPILPPRNSCTSPLPTCASPCSKLLPCGHLCTATCHWGTCPPCTEQVVRTCRCGGSKHTVRCGDPVVSGRDPSAPASNEILCDKACSALRVCGRHQCGRICCPLASLQRAKGKKRRDPTDTIVELGTEEGGLHECDIPCSRVMECGNHRCLRRDHKGSCGVCLRSVFEELMCPCGRTTLEPPISCGTRVDCAYPCARPPPCGHPSVPHLCHEVGVVAGADTPDEGLGLGSEEPGACPPCPFLTRKICACGKKMVDNVRCSQERVSCGSVCGRLLACGFHQCQRLCHADECGTCTAVCGKSRKSCLPAHHPCTQTCHAPTSCPETEPCLASVTLTCPCGHLRSAVTCSGNKFPLTCTGECAIKKRNARLAEALGISEEKRDAMGARTNVTWSEELIAFVRGPGNAKFLGLVEKAFSDFITSTRRTQVLPHMPPERRKFVHDLASAYRMNTVMVDQEPKRSVELIRRIDTRIPTPALSQYVASSGPSLGKLLDLRATAAGPSRGVGVSAGRWSMVTAKSTLAPVPAPASPWGGTSPARVPSPAGSSGRGAVRTQGAGSSGSSGSSGARGGVGDKRSVWMSPSVQAQRAREGVVAVQKQDRDSQDVPGDWEDDV
ncbi:hypothetical protein PAXINDRAFT_115013 [Paxillus involutus ATCC 200175]|uniref:R3H domain-containing protein n=1 Tax=Paxillus involutus ATCC 200175 TaxID=664439 RepID=A0A0C9TYF6_PAXIN|nr:hypothetical protein PAXINDRAFT_115013 [Paxillus involutus ATCC 200175]